MNYFDDIRFVMGGHTKDNNRSPVKGRWPDFYSIQFDRSNRIFYEIDGKHIGEMDAPVIYLTHPDKTYRFGPCNDSPWFHTCIGVTGPRAKRIFEQGFCQLSPNDMLAVHKPNEVAEIFDALIENFRSGDPGKQYESVIKLEQLLGMLIENQTMSSPELPFAEEFRDIAAKIEMSPFEPWDFKEFAQELFISYSHFRKLFTEHIRQPPHEFLLSMRMRRAAHWLETTSKPVKEICYQCNYDDLAQFSKAFKQKIGLSPRQFRNSLRLG